MITNISLLEINIMKTRKEKYKIRAFLVERYLNGYSINDTRYYDLIDVLVNQLKKVSISHNLEEKLKNSLGFYNALTAGIYLEIYIKYMRMKPKNSTINKLSLL